MKLGETSKQTYVYLDLGESNGQEFTIRFEHTAFQTSYIQETNPAPPIPTGRNAISSRSPWHGHVKAQSQDMKSVSKAQSPVTVARYPCHNTTMRSATSNDRHQQVSNDSYLWAGHCKRYSCLCSLCCADQIA